MIYALVDEYGTPRYVGQTTKTLATRLSQHRSAARSGQRQLERWLRSCPGATIIPLEVKPDDLDKAERRWIKTMRDGGVPLLNISSGRTGHSGVVRSPEVRARQSAARKGKQLATEHREKLSRAHTGVALSPEHRVAIGNGGRGLVRSAESRARLSASKMGNLNPMSSAARARRAAAGGDAL